MHHARRASAHTVSTWKNIHGRSRLGTAVLLTTVGLLTARAELAWSGPPEAATTTASQLDQMGQSLETNRNELDKVREKLIWAQELLQHVGETLYLAQAQHEQTLAVQHTLEQKLASVRAQSTQRLASDRTAADAAAAADSQELKRYRTQIRELQRERDQLQQALVSRDQRLSTLEGELQTTRGALQRAKENAVTSQRNLYQVHTQYEVCQNQWGDFRNKLDRLNITVAAAQQSLSTTVHIRNMLQNRLSACNANLSQVRASFASMEPVGTLQALPDEAPAQMNIETPPATENLPAETTTPEKQESTHLDDGDVPCNDTDATDSPSADCSSEPGISLEGVKFRYDSADLEQESRILLDRAAATLIQQPTLTHEVAGHTDSQGNAAYNLWLSLQRANAVRNYLLTRGVDGERLVARGYGGSQPIADNHTWEGLTRNRRVELHVIPHQETATIDTASLNTAY